MVFWRRAEVYMGYSLEEFNRCRQALSQAGIPHEEKIAQRTGGGGFSGRRANPMGINMDYASTYYVYVDRDDVLRAKAALWDGR